MASTLLRVSRFAKWTPHLPQIYAPCLLTKEWGTKGRMPPITHATLRAMDSKYKVPVMRNAMAKYDVAKRWRELFVYSNAACNDNVYIKEKTKAMLNIAFETKSAFISKLQSHVFQSYQNDTHIHPSCVGFSYGNKGEKNVYLRCVGNKQYAMSGVVVVIESPLSRNAALTAVKVMQVNWTRKCVPQVICTPQTHLMNNARGVVSDKELFARLIGSLAKLKRA